MIEKQDMILIPGDMKVIPLFPENLPCSLN